MSGALVTKVSIGDIEGEMAAPGAELADGRKFMARKDVIVGCRVIRTPQIVMLPGIGPKEQLKQLE